MKQDGFLEKFQDTLRSFLQTRNEFRNVPILTYKQSDFESIVQSSVYKGIGAVILILQPQPIKVQPNIAGPVFERILCKIQVIENIETNVSGLSSLFIAERITQYLHLWRPEIGDWNDTLALVENSPWSSDCDDCTNIITLNFETNCSLQNL